MKYALSFWNTRGAGTPLAGHGTLIVLSVCTFVTFLTITPSFISTRTTVRAVNMPTTVALETMPAVPTGSASVALAGVTPTALPTHPPTATPSITPTPTILARIGNQVRTGQWVITILGAKRADWVPLNNQMLESAGQWLIVYGEAQNLTSEPITLHANRFHLALPSLGTEIELHELATQAAGQLFGVHQTLASPSGMEIPPGQRKVLILAFFTPRSVQNATLQILDAQLSIDLGAIPNADILPTPLPTHTPTNTPTATPTPSPTLTATPTNTPDPDATRIVRLVTGPADERISRQHDQSKLGIHVQWNNSPELMAFIRRAQPAVVKAVDDLGFLGEVKAVSPSTVTIGRLNKNSQIMEGDPAEVARKYVEENLGFYYNNPWVDYWEGYNEPGIGGRMDWYATFEAERVRVMAEHGFRTAIGGFAAGVPEWDEFAAFLPAIKAAYKYGGILTLHEYDAPLLARSVGAGLPGHSSHPDRGALALRYRWWYEDFLKPRGLVLPLVISEAGIDGGIPDRPGPLGLGWWDFTNYWGSHTNLGKNGTDAYIRQLAWYDTELRKDRYVVGFAVFTAGVMSDEWQSFDITPILPNLATYVNTHR